MINVTAAHRILNNGNAEYIGHRLMPMFTDQTFGPMAMKQHRADNPFGAVSGKTLRWMVKRTESHKSQRDVINRVAGEDPTDSLRDLHPPGGNPWRGCGNVSTCQHAASAPPGITIPGYSIY